MCIRDRIMNVCVLLLLTPVVSGFLFNLFKPKKNCEPPFNTSQDDNILENVWQGFFKCPYEPTENPNATVEDFVRFFYIQSGQYEYSVASVAEITNMINQNYSNYLLVHGFNDGVRTGGK